MVAVSTVIFDLQGRATTELFENFEGLLTNLFLSCGEPMCPLDQVHERVLHDKFTLLFQSP